MDRTLLDTEALAELTETFPDWDIADGEMTRTFVLPDFPRAIGFVTEVAFAAEKLDHHPDIDIRWNTVCLVLSTHSAGGLTGLDRALAGMADDLAR